MKHKPNAAHSAAGRQPEAGSREPLKEANMKRTSKIHIAIAVTAVVLAGLATPLVAREAVNVVQDYGAEQGSSVWQESRWPIGAPGVSDSHNNEKAKDGDYSFLTDATTPNSSGKYYVGLIQNFDFDFSPTELSFDYNLEFVNNDWNKSEGFYFFFINEDQSDTLRYAWLHPDLSRSEDTQKRKSIYNDMPNFQDTWKNQFKNTKNDLSNKGWGGEGV